MQYVKIVRIEDYDWTFVFSRQRKQLDRDENKSMPEEACALQRFILGTYSNTYENN